MTSKGRSGVPPSRTVTPRIRRRPSKRRERAALFIGLAAVLVIIAIPLAGYVVTFVLPPRETVVRVNDTKYTMGDIVKLLRVFQRENEASGTTMNMGILPFQVVNTLAENELIRQGASGEGLTVSSQEVDDELRVRMLGALDPESEATEDELEMEFRERYRDYLNLIQLSEGEHRDLVTLDLYREKLQDALAREVPQELPQVHLFKISVETEEDVDEVRTEFARGALFADLVEKYDGGAEAVRKDGEVGWIPRGLMPELDPLIFDTLVVGELSEAQPELDRGTNALALVMYLVVEISDDREVADNHRGVLQRLALNQWIATQREANRVENRFNSDQYEWVLKQLGLSVAGR
jgi:parvulin-like peptidyl-prolyl isomerase